MTDDERLAVIRSMIQHEDALRDQRFGWLLALNGLLFTALGFIWNDSRSVALIIAALGAAFALASLATLRISTLAVALLRERAEAAWTVAPLLLVAAWTAVFVVRLHR